MRKHLGFLLALSVAGTAIAAVKTTEAVASLKARYSRINSVHLLAKVEMWVQPQAGKPIKGTATYEYWARGDSYRIRTRTDPSLRSLGIASDVEIAFDENQWQLLNPQDSLLSLASSEPAVLPVPHPNPFFLPLEFIAVDGSDCRGCQLKLGHLRQGATWDRPERAGRIQGRTPGKFFDVTFAEVDGVPVPASIVRLDARGVKDSEISAEQFATPDSTVGPLPLRVNVKEYASDGKTQFMEATFSIEVLEINQDLPASTFTINPTQVLKVYDSDAGIFLKNPDDRVRGRAF